MTTAPPPGSNSSLLLSIFAFDTPHLAGTSREADLLALWHQHVSQADPSSDADYEDWVEQAARLKASLAATTDVHLTLDGRIATSLLTSRSTPITDLAHLARYGADRTTEHLPDLPTDTAADHYYRLQTFHRLAQRAVSLVGHDSEAERSELVDGVLAMHEQGIRRIIVKVARTKYAIYDLTLPETLTYTQAHTLLSTALGWTMVHLDGRPNAFILQEHVQMEYEYRLFIVGGRPVTGAGCVEEHTPLDNQDVFDQKVQQQRGKSPVVTAPGVVAALVDFGEQAAVQLGAEEPRLTSYVLDVAMGKGGPLMVECNALRNSGLYASQPERVVAALLREQAR
jgi:hypothetical protein